MKINDVLGRAQLDESASQDLYDLSFRKLRLVAASTDSVAGYVLGRSG